MSTDNTDRIDEEAGDFDFTPASYSIDLNLPEADEQLLRDASRAIRREYRDSAKWKRLKCRSVRVVSEGKTGTIYELQIGHAVEIDWTWEAAVAFRPVLLQEFEDSEATFFENGSLDPDIDDSIVWSGEVLEVDEAKSRIFIVVASPEHRPRRGSFYVRPFNPIEPTWHLFITPHLFNTPIQHIDPTTADTISPWRACGRQPSSR